MQYLHRIARDGSEWPSVIYISLFDVYLNTLPYSFCVCMCVCVCVCVDCGLCVCDCKYMCVCACVHAFERERERKRERAREQKWFLFSFLGKTCKVAILTEVLLLGMDVVELMRKCVALCRLQQLPDTSPWWYHTSTSTLVVPRRTCHHPHCQHPHGCTTLNTSTPTLVVPHVSTHPGGTTR